MKDKFYFLDGTTSSRRSVDKRLHRENDLPAIEFCNGDKYWYVDGKIHREGNKPSCISVNGYKYQAYYVKGKYHRTNGPAVENENGSVEYFLNGCNYSKEDYRKCIKCFDR